MNSTRTALVAALSCLVLWAAKALAISAAGGLGKSPLEGPLFLLGLLAALVSAVACVWSFARDYSVAVRALAGLGALVGAVLLAVVVQAGVSAIEPANPGWVWGEVNLWCIAVVVLAGALLLRSREGRSVAVRRSQAAAR